jgi:hypothetical protein
MYTIREYSPYVSADESNIKEKEEEEEIEINIENVDTSSVSLEKQTDTINTSEEEYHRVYDGNDYDDYNDDDDDYDEREEEVIYYSRPFLLRLCLNFLSCVLRIYLRCIICDCGQGKRRKCCKKYIKKIFNYKDSDDDNDEERIEEEIGDGSKNHPSPFFYLCCFRFRYQTMIRIIFFLTLITGCFVLLGYITLINEFILQRY